MVKAKPVVREKGVWLFLRRLHLPKSEGVFRLLARGQRVDGWSLTRRARPCCGMAGEIRTGSSHEVSAAGARESQAEGGH